MRRSLVFVCLAVAFWAALPAHASSDAKELYVVFGGFNSCKAGPKGGAVAPEHMTMARPFRDTVEAQTKNYDVILTCLDSSGTQLTYQKGWGGTPQRLGKDSFTSTQNMDALADLINRRAGNGRRVHFVGHSLGGWLAVRMAQRLSARIRLGNIVTIDPISPLYCDRNQFLHRTSTQLTKSVSGYLKGTPLPSLPPGGDGCVQAPRDISPKEQTQLLGRAAREGGRWLNFYQTQFSYLHSGPFSELGDDNLEVTDFRTQVPLATWQSFNAHSRIFAADWVWERLNGRPTAVAAANPETHFSDTH